MGEKTKVTTELVGALAGSMGGGWLAAFAGESATVIDRMKAMGEVGKTNTAGMLAFKVGIIATAGAITVKLIKAMVDYNQKAELMKVKTENVKTQFDDVLSRLEKQRGGKFMQELAKIDLVPDTEKRVQAQEELLKKLSRELNLKTRFRNLEAKALEAMKGETGILGFQSGHHKGRIALQEQTHQILKSQTDQLQAQADELRKRLGPERELQKIRDANAKALEDESRKQQMVKSGIDAATQAFIKRVNLIKKEREESARAAKEQARQQERLNKDKERAMQKIASIEERMGDLSNGSDSAGANTAVTSRFSSGRAVQTDYAKITADEIAKHTKIYNKLSDQMAEQHKVLQEIRDKESALEVAR